MLDFLFGWLKLKTILYWVVVYIFVNILEYIVIHMVLKWMFGTKEENNADLCRNR
jgi:hypothetical protein